MRPAFIAIAFAAAAFASPVPAQNDVAVIGVPASDVNAAYVDGQDVQDGVVKSVKNAAKSCVAAVVNEANKHIQAACKAGVPATPEPSSS